MRVPASVIESRRATRRHRIAALALVALSLVGVVLHFTDASAAPKTRAPKVTYIECSHGHHLWVTEQGGIYGVPAGTACP